MRRRRAAGVLAALLLAGCGDLGDPPVMTLGSEVYHLGDFRRELADLPTIERPSLDTREARRAFAEGVASRHLLASLGEEIVEKDPEERKRLEAECRSVLVRRLRTLAGGEPRLSEEEIQEATERMAVQWRIRRYRFPDAAAAEEAMRAFRAQPDEAVWAGTGVVVGDGIVQWSPFPDGLLDRVAEAKVGEVIGPFESPPGSDIVLVLDRAPAEPGDPDEVRARALRGLRVRAQSERVDSLVTRLRDEADVRWNTEAIAWLAEKTRAAILREGARSNDRDWAVPAVEPGEEDRVVAEWRGGAVWTAGDYRDALREALPAQRPRVRLEKSVAAACESGVVQRLLYEEALRRDLDREWWAERAIDRLREELWQAAAVRHLRDLRSPASAEVDSLTSLLLSAQPQLFRQADQARVAWFELPSRPAAERERAVVAARGVTGRLQDLLDGTPPPMVGTYHLTILTRGAIEVPAIESDVFGGGPGTLSGPHELRGQWILAACLDLVPGRELSREEALEDVWERTRQAGGSVMAEQWVAARKQELGLSIDEDALDALAPGA